MKPRFDLFIFADALGWERVKAYDVLSDLLPCRMPCETLLGYSATCDPTILTGAWPDEHGHFSFFVKAQGQSPFKQLGCLGWLPHRLAAHHRVRNRISRWVARQHGYTGYFQLYSVPFRKLPLLDYTEKRDIYEPGGIIGGQPTIFQTWEASGKPWFRSDWRLPDAENFAQAREHLRKGEAELGYLFTAGLDAIMHRHGPEHPQVAEAFAVFAERVRELYTVASGNYREVFIHLFSDHGMAKVEHASDLMRRWESLKLRYGEDYIAVWDSTMVRLWFHHEGARERALGWLAEQPDGQLLSNEQLAHWRCLFDDGRYGEHFFLLHPGHLLVPSFMNLGMVSGMHGYTPEHPDSMASFLTNNPEAEARQLPDIFKVMSRAAS